MNPNNVILLAFGFVFNVTVDCCKSEFGEFVFFHDNRKQEIMKANYNCMLEKNVLDAPEFNKNVWDDTIQVE
eukprot:9613455-Ditylum_brightwellii.AAC.1